MLPSTEPEPHFDFVVSQMTQAGWLTGHTFLPGVGYKLHWTDIGRQRALLLQKLIRQHSLTNPCEAKRFTRICLGSIRPADDEQIELAERGFWLACLEELFLGNEENALAALVEVLNSWSPQSK